MMEIKQVIQITGLSDDDKHVLNDFAEALWEFCSCQDCDSCSLNKVHANFVLDSCPNALRAILETLKI